MATLLDSWRPRRTKVLPGVPAWDGPFSPGAWGDLERALRYVRNKTPYDVLNKHVRSKTRMGILPELPRLDQTNCSISSELWPADRIVATFPSLPGSHERCNPVDESSPIICVRHAGVFALVDGRTRINKWRNGKETGLRQVIIVEPATGTAPET